MLNKLNVEKMRQIRTQKNKVQVHKTDFFALRIRRDCTGPSPYIYPEPFMGI